MIIAVGIVSIPILARITRANTLAWSQREFVMAARAQGAKDRRVMFRDVLPNVMPAILSIALLGVAIVIVLEGALAIFGLSIPLPYASWGNMINSQISQLDARAAGVARAVDPDRVHRAVAQLSRRRGSVALRRS